MKLADFDYYLPAELIAQEPAPERDCSRLMVLRRDRQEIEHRLFRAIVEYLNPGDTLVLNESKVIPARLWGTKEKTGARVEVLLLKAVNERCWEVLVKPGRKVREGDRLIFGDVLSATVTGTTPVGGRVLEFTYTGSFFTLLEQVGAMPLPPYIKKQPRHPGRYQTVYASKPGSVAAPTAGLHFTRDLLNAIKQKDVRVVFITLHVGLGTFRPVKVENVEEHHMHAEYYEIGDAVVRAIEDARHEGGRVIAVGTTTTRCLESAAAGDGRVIAGSGWTDLFIYPGYEFKVIDGLVTNFHLPKSTLLMMVAAFAGREKILHAYRVAVEKRYRFFSFGDAMLII